MNHEHEQSHASSMAATTATTHSDTVEPGQSTRSALLRKTDHAVASGLLQRKVRDATGVADGAEHAVATASLSRGFPLPETLMRKFESSLGTDLSGVRIHTSGASERAADAVGAKAYTMGNDIHFGADHYDPSSSSGEHLLAHEVVHTVQQSGGAQRMQFKLEVSSPDDSFEHDADRAADAMVSGSAATVSGASGLSRHALQRKPPASGNAHKDTDQHPAVSPNTAKSVEDHASEALLISYPDYLIDTESPLGRVGGLGHAGVLLIRSDGTTRYYEYGRYPTKDKTKGRVRMVPVPSVKIGPNGKARPESLDKVLGHLSRKSGQRGRIDAAYFQNVNYAVMEAHAQQKLKESNPEFKKDYKKDRAPYKLGSNNCATFAEDVITQDKHVNKPNVFVGSPNNTVSEYQEEGNAKVAYDPNAKKGTPRLTIGTWDEDDAKQ